MALGIDYNSGIPHTNGAPTHDPGTNGGKLAYDHVNRVKYKWVSGTTWEVDASGGGGGDSLGTGFTSGGGSGAIPSGTVASTDGSFEIEFNNNTNGSEFSLVNNVTLANGQADDYLGFVSQDGSVSAGVGRWIADESELSFMSFATLNDRVSEFIQSPYLFQIAARKADFSKNGLINLLPTSATISVGGISVSLTEAAALSYASDNSALISSVDRAIPDVGTVKLINLSGPAQYTTTGRNALTPSAGWTIYNTTLNKTQTYDGSAWQSHW